MHPAPATDPNLLEDLLRRACAMGASATLRQVGSGRILGDLQVVDLEPSGAVVLRWDNGRERAPEVGAEVTLSLVVEEEVHTLRAAVLEAVQPHLRVSWPVELLATGPRARLRVAAPDQSPLEARICQGEACRSAELQHLTESGMVLSVDCLPEAQAGDEVMVETTLPGGRSVAFACRVQAILPGEGLRHPLRLDLRFERLPEDVREGLQRFIQARRADRSELLRA